MKKQGIAAVLKRNGPEGRRFCRDVGGFSLVEMLIAMAVGMVVLGAVYSVFTVQNKTFSNQEDYVEMQQSVRAGMDLMAREIGLSGYDPLRVNADSDTANNFAGVTVDGTQLQVRADLDSSGAIDASSQENITYAYDSTAKQITRNAGSGNQPFIENVDSFTFEYLDGNGNTTTTAANVRRIRITITGRTAKPDPQYTANGGYRTYSLTSVVSPRNLAY